MHLHWKQSQLRTAAVRVSFLPTAVIISLRTKDQNNFYEYYYGTTFLPAPFQDDMLNCDKTNLASKTARLQATAAFADRRLLTARSIDGTVAPAPPLRYCMYPVKPRPEKTKVEVHSLFYSRYYVSSRQATS